MREDDSIFCISAWNDFVSFTLTYGSKASAMQRIMS